MDGYNDETPGHEPAANWFSDTFRQFNFLALLRERNQIRKICAELLREYKQVKSQLPQAAKHELYARVVANHTGADADGVRRTLRRAEERFAVWPEERDLNFRDLASYFAVMECRNADPKTMGVRADVVDIVAHAIPADL